MPASGDTIAVTSVMTLRFGPRPYRDSSPALKICAAKTCDSLLKYSYSRKDVPHPRGRAPSPGSGRRTASRARKVPVLPGRGGVASPRAGLLFDGVAEIRHGLADLPTGLAEPLLDRALGALKRTLAFHLLVAGEDPDSFFDLPLGLFHFSVNFLLFHGVFLSAEALIGARPSLRPLGKAGQPLFL